MIDVLVVDDDFMVARIHAGFIERVDGFRVAGRAGSGSEALEAVARLRPGLVLLDVHLPDIDGIEVLRRIRAEGHDVGVIVVTAARESDVVRGALHGGATSYLTKPFEFDDLVQHLTSFREAYGRLAREDAPAQGDIDAVFGVGTARRPASMPKGLSSETASAVRQALVASGDVSAAECAEAVGISRVSARRYLEHFATTGVAQVRPRYGTSGRPERRYRPLGPS